MLEIAPIFIKLLEDFRAEGRTGKELIEISMKIAQKWRRRGHGRSCSIEVRFGSGFIDYMAMHS